MKKDRKTKELRRNIELLRAQLKIDTQNHKPQNVPQPIFERIEPGATATSRTTSNPAVAHENALSINTKQISKDLLKTLVLSALSFSVILTLWLQSR